MLQILNQCNSWKNIHTKQQKSIIAAVKKLSLAAGKNGEITEQEMDTHSIPNMNSETEDENCWNKLSKLNLKADIIELLPTSTAKAIKRPRAPIGERCVSHRRAVWVNNDNVVSARKQKAREIEEERRRKEIEKEVIARDKARKKEEQRQIKLKQEEKKKKRAAEAKDMKKKQKSEIKSLKSENKSLKSEIKSLKSKLKQNHHNTSTSEFDNYFDSFTFCGSCNVELTDEGNNWVGCEIGCEQWFCEDCNAIDGLMELHEKICCGESRALKVKEKFQKNNN